MHTGEELIRWFDGKHILVTGASGYLVSYLVGMLRSTDCSITLLTRSRREPKEREGSAHIDRQAGDLQQRETWQQALRGVDIVFHFAAQTSVKVANADPVLDFQCNVLPLQMLLESCRDSDRHPTVLLAGTVTQAGIPERLPLDEAHPDSPITIYDLHKQMAEQYLAYYSRHGIVSGATLRLSNVYGPGPKSSASDRGILNMMIKRALRGEPLTIYGSGEYLRDYIYIEDVILAFLTAARHIKKLRGEHFLIGSGKGHTLSEVFLLVAERVSRRTGSRVPVVHVEPETPLTPIEKRNLFVNPGKFSKATGWHPRYSLAEGIDHTLETLL